MTTSSNGSRRGASYLRDLLDDDPDALNKLSADGDDNDDDDDELSEDDIAFLEKIRLEQARRAHSAPELVDEILAQAAEPIVSLVLTADVFRRDLTVDI